METIQANTGFVWFLSVIESDNGDQEVAFIIHGTLLSESAPRQQPVSISCVHTLRRRRRAEWANFGYAARGGQSDTSGPRWGRSPATRWRWTVAAQATFPRSLLSSNHHLLGDMQAVNDQDPVWLAEKTANADADLL